MNDWTQETWLDASLVESYRDSEDVTYPAAQGLIAQSGISDSTRARLLDIGAGMGQVTEAFYDTRPASIVTIDCMDIDDGLLAALKEKKAAKGWSNVQVIKEDATVMTGIKDATYDFIIGNFLYFLVSDPQAALKESLRALRPGGTLAFTTWALSGPFATLQLAQASLPDYPLATPNARLQGHWNHPRYVRDQLTALGYTDVKITPHAIIAEAESPAQMAWKLRHAVMLHTLGWGAEREEKGWELTRAVEETLRRDQGEGRVVIRSVVLLITAKKAA